MIDILSPLALSPPFSDATSSAPSYPTLFLALLADVGDSLFTATLNDLGDSDFTATLQDL